MRIPEHTTKRAEQLVRRIVTEDFNQKKVDQETVRTVAHKVSRTIPRMYEKSTKPPGKP
jgi:hypothetical protein